ncbi:type II secretion system protein [Oxalicibacterium faecigallinarum]|uniref:Uncharacterized protein n=1 Tax=Oxalicibacterium faecigallinarum TaxID=573741 RepID=A0A8J3AW99_9BURK|nr:hypothetical protein [Oxalicibacterium faecigallinarum]GGI21676.1 hypothetical protein GCM10008066_30240 [Oxalicibacterium faecigallinarum]
MTKKSYFINAPKNNQQGDALLEALVGMLLIAVLGLGLAYAAGRAMNAQRYAATHGIVLSEMRNAMEKTGIKTLCTGSGFTINPTLADGSHPIPALNIPAPTNCTPETITVSVRNSAGGIDTSFPTSNVSIITRMQLSTPTAESVLGPGVVTLSQ